MKEILIPGSDEVAPSITTNPRVYVIEKKQRKPAEGSSGERLQSITKTEVSAVPSSAEEIKSKIYTIRGVQVMLDRDLASLYGVLTKNLNKAVKRNQERFPEDFMFQLTKEEGLRFQIGTLNNGGSVLGEEEVDVLRFQTGTLKLAQGKHFKYQPYAFTENGIAMLSSVLRSDRAIGKKCFAFTKLAASEIANLKARI